MDPEKIDLMLRMLPDGVSRRGWELPGKREQS